MSAPPLPDAFGNYALGEFVEVVAPAAISWLPQTVAWYCLGVVLLALGLYRGWQQLRRRYRNRYRREAAIRLKVLSLAPPGELDIAAINRLLKLTALAGYSRQQVAGLWGTDWVEFLNQQCPEPPFGEEQVELLAVGSYRQTLVDDDARRGLLEACLTWIMQHQGPEHA